MVMPTQVTITAKDEGLEEVTGEVYGEPTLPVASSGDMVTIIVELARDYMTAEDDPVLAELWDNEEDAAYDNL